MKKPLNVPVIAASLVAVLCIVGLVLYKAGSGQAEFAPPAIPKVVPKYIYDRLPASEQKRYKDEGYTVSDGAPPTVGPKAGR